MNKVVKNFIERHASDLTTKGLSHLFFDAVSELTLKNFDHLVLVLEDAGIDTEQPRLIAYGEVVKEYIKTYLSLWYSSKEWSRMSVMLIHTHDLGLTYEDRLNYVLDHSADLGLKNVSKLGDEYSWGGGLPDYDIGWFYK